MTFIELYTKCAKHYIRSISLLNSFTFYYFGKERLGQGLATIIANGYNI